MQRLLIIMCVLLATTGCRDGQFIRDTFTSTACGGGGVSLTGYTLTGIQYGDSRLLVLPISKIRPDSEFRFALMPKVLKTDDPVVYRDAHVTISSPDDDTDTPANWLDVSGTFNGSTGSLVTCVPPQSGLTKAQYKYTIKVSWPGTAATDTLGLLDPRADVIDN